MRKRLIIAASVTTVLIVIILVAVRILGGVLQRNNISWSSLTYHFPGALTIEGITAAPNESFRLELDHLEVAWSWGSLLRGRPSVTMMLAQNGTIIVHTRQDTTARNPFHLPRLSLKNIDVEDIHFSLCSGSDSIHYQMERLRLSSATTGDRILVDTLQLSRASLMIARAESDDGAVAEGASDSGTPLSLEGIPGFEIGYLGLEQCRAEIRQDADRQRIDRLNLVFTGWKSSEMLNVKVNRFGFLYQDTLEVELVLENGEVNREFHADLSDLGIAIPGAALNIKQASADLQEGTRGTIALGPSYMTMGRIRQLYPGIDSILHPALPDSTRIRLQGGVELESKRLALHSLLVRVMDSTSMDINGNVVLDEGPVLDLQVRPFTSTRGNLLTLLTPQNYHRFYLWPHDIDGEITAEGTLGDLGIYGTLDSREGLILAESHVKSESTGEFYFSLDIWSDSVFVNGITPLLPMSVPHGQVRFFLEMKRSGADEETPLWITITSDHLYTFDQYIHNILFSYYGDERIDSMHASINDTVVDLLADLVTPGEGDGTTRFDGRINHLFANRLIPSLPEGYVSTTLKGSYLFGEQTSDVGLELKGLRIVGDEGQVTFPDSRLQMFGEGDRMSVRGETEEGPFLTASTGTAFPDFSQPIPEWLNRWPETDVQLHLLLKEELITMLTGTPGRLELETFSVVKDSTRWNARAVIPQITYGEQSLQHLELDLLSDRKTLSGQLAIDAFENPSISVEEISTDLGYLDNQYWFEIRNESSELIGANRLSLLVDASDSTYLVRFNDSVPLLINSDPWQVGVNRGVELDEGFRLMAGDLGIRHGVSSLEAATNGKTVTLRIDSMELKPLLSYLTDGEVVKGTLNAKARLNTPGMDVSWDARVVAFNELVPDPAEIEIRGLRTGEALEALIDFHHMDASAHAEVSKREGPLSYVLNLDRFDLDALRYLPSLPPDLEVSGRLSGEARGILGEQITADGYIVTEELRIVPPMTGSPLTLDHDTLIMKNGEVILDDFTVIDSRGEALTLKGVVRYSPDLYGSIHLHSDKFALLQNQDRDARLQGTLYALADLLVEGGTEELKVSGNLQTLPGADVRYISEKSFTMVDASQTVTFMDLDEEESTLIRTPSKQRLKIDWNVDLQVNESSFEILLDEITQQFIRIVSHGTLNMRSGTGSTPMIFGSVTSSSGHAFISPPVVPDLDLVVEDATIRWEGLLDEPIISFRGYKLVKGLTSGLTQLPEESGQLVDYKVYVILDKVTLSEFDLQFDLEVEDSEGQILLASLPKDTRQAYALNLLVFGRIGTEKIKGNDVLARQVTQKLNEISRRNLKNTGLNFYSANYTDRSDGINERERTDVSYTLSRGFLNNRLSVSVGGSVGFYMDDMTVLPPSNLIGDLELSYRLSDNPTLILKGTRNNVYEGIIDGLVTQESVGLTFQKSYPTFPLFQGKKEPSPDEANED